MKNRLFWKIILAFWVTVSLVNIGSWLIFLVHWNPPPSPQWIANQRVAPVHLASARYALETGGMPAYRRLVQGWPEGSRDAISIVDMGPVKAGQRPSEISAHSGQQSMNAVLPDGRQVELHFRREGDSRPALSFGMLLRRSANSIIALAIGGLVFAAGLAWYMTRPIQAMREGFGRLASGNMETRLSPDMGTRRDEIADLARDFDAMAARLEQLVAMRDQLLHDVSHELRSPLARFNLAIALMRQNPAKAATSIERIETEVRRLDELVGELLSLARFESGAQRQESYFELNELVENVVANAQFEAKAKDVRVEGPQPSGNADTPDWIIRGEFELMRRALENVVRNAVKISDTGQTVRLGISEHNGGVCLTISDEGPGVPEAGLASMFDPFVRYDPQSQREGFGLGLAIAQRAVQALEGTIQARNRPTGGLEMVITLPLYRRNMGER